MVKIETKYRILLGTLGFILYLFLAARPVPQETILRPRWLSSLESNYPIYFNGEGNGMETAALEEPASAGTTPGSATRSIPFELGERFGYVGEDGRFLLNRVKQGYLSISEDYWSEYPAIPDNLEIRNPQDGLVTRVNGNPGYPFFMDNRIFLLSDEGASLRRVSPEGEILWTYDFAAPLTDIDAASGLILAGTLDGTLEVLDDTGKRFFFFEPGGSRLPVILGCRISRDGSKIGIISGYDDQRFLFLERSDDTYKVSYHEFLSDGFKRAAHIAFIDQDRRIAFEREGGLEIFTIANRRRVTTPLEGQILALDNSGEDNLLFVITSLTSRRRRLVGIRFPGQIIMEAPFSGDRVFLHRKDTMLYIGGGNALASFAIDRR